MIVGTWRTRADWERWHGSEAFTETCERLQGLEARPHEGWWHETILDVRTRVGLVPPDERAA